MRFFSRAALFGSLLTLGLTQVTNAQFYIKEERKLLDKADKAFDDEDYVGALKIYQTVLSNVPKQSYAIFKAGICYLNLSRPEKGLAQIKLAREIDPDGSAAFYYWLGRGYHLNQKIDSAIYYYKRFQIMSGASKNDLTEDANLHLKQAEDYLKMKTSTDAQSFRLENMGGAINSPYTESNPLVASDGSFMVFTSRRPYPGETAKYDGEFTSKIYYSKKQPNGRWGQAQLLVTPDVGQADYTSLQFLDNDNFILIYRHSQTTDGQLLIAERFKDEIRQPIPYKLGIANSNLEIDAYFTNKIDRVFFTKFPKRTFLDIFTSVKDKSGNWGSIAPLGLEINKPDNDELAPFLTADQKEFFFCSKRNDGLGGYDIFRADFDAATGKFSNIRNAGLPYNSPGDEINYYEINNKGQRESYIAAERNSCFGKTDLFKLVKLEYVNITGRVTTTGGKPLANAMLAVTHFDFDDCDYLIKTDAQGNYKLMNVLAGSDYKVAFLQPENAKDTISIMDLPVPNQSGKTNMTYNFDVTPSKFVVPARPNMDADKPKRN